MPDKSGFEIIDLMKQDPRLAQTEVILITGTHFDRDIQERYVSKVLILQKNGLSYRQALNCIKALSSVFSAMHSL